MRKKILVYGFFAHSNKGDDLFMEAYQYLFPEYDFTFVDNIDLNHLIGKDAVFFGGGSFLLDRPTVSQTALDHLKTMKIFYLGVGIEEDIHPVHVDLMQISQMIATRSKDQLERLRFLNNNVIFIPDLVFALQPQVDLARQENHSILIIPNVYVVPQNSELHWKHIAWDYFRSEFGQFLDWLVENGYKPNFFAMCHDRKADDDWASYELVSSMEQRSISWTPFFRPKNFHEIVQMMSRYSLVITQRFHGIILSEMTRTPYLVIAHHDKLKPTTDMDGVFISYYGCSKKIFIDAFLHTQTMQFRSPVPVESAIFEAFKRDVMALI
jgi:polysaccharide pyruvyl transferase WcaK-like protein